MCIKYKEKIFKAFKGGDNHDHTSLDKALYKWLIKVREEAIPFICQILKEKAMKYAKEFNIKNFKASNGWFD